MWIQPEPFRCCPQNHERGSKTFFVSFLRQSGLWKLFMVSVWIFLSDKTNTHTTWRGWNFHFVCKVFFSYIEPNWTYWFTVLNKSLDFILFDYNWIKLFNLIGLFEKKIQLKSGHISVPSTKIRKSTIYYAGLLGRWDKWIVGQESDVSSIISFILFIDLGHSKLFVFILVIL